jgi:hypothetical protein
MFGVYSYHFLTTYVPGTLQGLLIKSVDRRRHGKFNQFINIYLKPFGSLETFNRLARETASKKILLIYHLECSMLLVQTRGASSDGRNLRGCQHCVACFPGFETGRAVNVNISVR